jgi:hypothetical protein
LRERERESYDGGARRSVDEQWWRRMTAIIVSESEETPHCCFDGTEEES